MIPSTEDKSAVIRAAGQGGRTAVHQLLPRVYDELRQIASAYLRRERSDHTLQTTALVNEAYLKLINQREVGWRDREQFFAVASMLMRRILVDHARRKKSEKRGGGRKPSPLDETLAAFEERAGDMLELDVALDRLAAFDQRKARIVELRFFAGLTMAETAEMIGCPLRTVERDWALARAWLRGEFERLEGD